MASTQPSQTCNKSAIILRHCNNSSQCVSANAGHACCIHPHTYKACKHVLCKMVMLRGRFSGEEWKGLNAVQKQLRRDTKLLYGTPRALLKLRPGFTLKGRAYESLFALQVQHNYWKDKLVLPIPSSP